MTYKCAWYQKPFINDISKLNWINWNFKIRLGWSVLVFLFEKYTETNILNEKSKNSQNDFRSCEYNKAYVERDLKVCTV